MSYNVRKQAIHKIKKARTIAIFMHNSPDGDCIGSAIAMEEVCKQIGKNVDVIFQDKLAKKYAPIVGEKRVSRIVRPKEGKRYDLAILLDCSDLNRTVHYINQISNELLVIDHHPNNTPFGNVFLHENECATGIIIYKIIKQMNLQITSSIATALYFSIVSDTNYFKNPNTNSTTHDVCGKLMNCDANTELILDIIESKSKNFYNLLSLVIPNIIYYKQQKMITLSITREQINKSGATDSDAALIVDCIKEIENTEIVLLFIEGITNVRIRARSKNIKVNNLLSHFGGGGHDRAAGCAIEGKDIEQVEDEVVSYTIKSLS